MGNLCFIEPSWSVRSEGRREKEIAVNEKI